MNKFGRYGVWMTRYEGCGNCCASRKRDVIRVNLDECEEQVIEVDGEHRIVIHKDYDGNLSIKTQHKEWVDDDSEPEYELQA